MRMPRALGLGLRCASTVSPRVLCSVAELRALGRDRALKFLLRADTQRTEHDPQIVAPTESRAARRSARSLATGFVFLCEKTGQPRAFANNCPHARLELDLDDSDFFCEGFLQCKAHGAFFDPQTGMCLQGPTGSRAAQQRKTIPGLASLDVRVDNSGNVVLLIESPSVQQQASPTGGHSADASEELGAYRLRKRQELAKVLSGRTDDVREIEQALHKKTMARMQQYKQQQKNSKP